jgi:hypothetical protein
MILNTDDLAQEIVPEEKIINLKYILELESLIIICKGGLIFKYKISEKMIENVGCIESGIKGATWSPN